MVFCELLKYVVVALTPSIFIVGLHITLRQVLREKKNREKGEEEKKRSESERERERERETREVCERES